MAEAPWMSRWQRSPRQDRRVIEDGKFVELGKVQIPEPPAEEVPEREESALELVVPAPNVPEQEQLVEADTASVKESQVVSEIKETIFDKNVDKEFKILPLPPIPEEAFEFIEDAQKANETITGIPGNLLTDEQSDALAETLRLPEPVDDEK